MMALQFYKNYLPVQTLDDVAQNFRKTLVPTNRSSEFFVDWKKIRENVDSIKTELALWDSLINSKSIKSDYAKLIADYPEVLKTMPILLAIREVEFPVITDFFSPDEAIKTYNFSRKKGDTLTKEEVEEFTAFAEKSGVLPLFSNVRNFHDYVMGVEVGMDTNARKNRSGDAMELAIKPLVEKLSKSMKFDFLFQRTFGHAQEKYGVSAPTELVNRKSDFIIHKGGKLVNIEVNYYSGSGSKPEEIVDSYINRRNELISKKWAFIWITDGDVWNTSHNQLKKGFDKLDYLLNLDFIKKGMLEGALREVLK
ncbi:Type-2 restriction enzyme MjaIII [uncultured archaeon]|nr:Type-2 restriction enzyme MjaIII [uncultured archaeon]